ncbi:helix-turn-helix domain-containing protein [Caballeronia sp. HLA56]
MSTFFERLREERKRLRLNQTVFAALAGVTKESQLKYENGSRRPDTGYLELVAAHGVDVAYLLTGVRSSDALAVDEQALLAGYRSLDERGRAGVLGMIGGMTQQVQPSEKKPRDIKQNFEGATIGQRVKGDITAPFTINMGMGKPKKKTDG